MRPGVPARRLSPQARMRLHLVLVAFWMLLTILTTAAAVIWPEHPLLMPWLIFISCYAIVSTHWSGFEGAAPSANEGGNVVQKLGPKAVQQVEEVAERAAAKALGRVRP